MDTPDHISIDTTAQRCDVYLGVRLGFYDALATAGLLAPAELASRTGSHEPFVANDLSSRRLRVSWKSKTSGQSRECNRLQCSRAA
jgi:hypothetical protein